MLKDGPQGLQLYITEQGNLGRTDMEKKVVSLSIPHLFCSEPEPSCLLFWGVDMYHQFRYILLQKLDNQKGGLELYFQISVSGF